MANYNKNQDGSNKRSAAKAAQNKAQRNAKQRYADKKKKAAQQKTLRNIRRAFEGANDFFQKAAGGFTDWYKKNEWWVDPAVNIATKFIPGISDDAAAALTYADDVIPLLLGGSNHPEWYTNMDPKVMPIGINYMADKSHPIGVDQEIHPSDEIDVHAKPYFRPEIMVNYIMNCIGAVEDHDLLVDNEIHRIVDVLNAASGRNANYDAADVRQYIYNTAMLTSMVALAVHFYETIYHVDSEDSAIQQSLRYAYGISNIDNLADFRDRMRELIVALYDMFPMFGDILERKVWLFSNSFIEPGTQKPAIVINRLAGANILGENPNQPGQIGIQWSANSSFFIGDDNLCTLEDVIRDLEDAIVSFRDYVASVPNELRADLMRIVGMDYSIALEKQFLAQLEPDIPGFRVLSDKYFNDQIMNSLEFSLLYQNDPITRPKYTVNGLGEIDCQPVEIPWIVADMDLIEQIFTDHFVNCPIEDVNNPGKQMSITRLQPNFEFIDRDDQDYLIIVAAGTEVVTRRCIIKGADLQSDNNVDFAVVRAEVPSISVLTDPVTTETINIILNANSALSDFDNAPITATLVEDGVFITPFVNWDFDQFGSLPRCSAARMHSIATASLIRPKIAFQTRNAFIESQS